MGKGVFFLGWTAIFILLPSLGSPAWGEGVTCHPDSLERTLFSKKTHTITFTGPAPEGCQIILKVISPAREFKLNRSGKGLGLIWLPVGHAQVKNVPGMYALLSSCRISDIPSSGDKNTTGPATDFQEIYLQAEIHHQKEPEPQEALRLNREYIAGLIQILKKKELYQQKEGAVEVSGGQYRAQLIHPADAPAGEYRVFCYALKDGQARLIAENHFTVKSTGLVAWLSQQAQRNAAVYGILAALFAVGVGLFVGVLFKKGGRH
jgi:hypothetical protein